MAEVIAHTTAPLSLLLSTGIEENLYNGSVPGRGWGSVFDATESLRTVGARPQGGMPQIASPDELNNWPERVLGRLYWNEQRPRQVRELLIAQTGGEQPAPEQLYSLHAADIIIYGGADQNEISAFIGENPSSSNGRRFDEACALLLETLRRVDEGATLTTARTGFGFGDDDFFRWLLYRFSSDSQITDGVSLEQVRNMVSRDVQDRPTSIGAEAILDRPALRTLVADPGARFGPADIALADGELNLVVEFKLWQDGSFAPKFSGETYYDLSPRVSREQTRLRATQDLAFKVIPELRLAYYADENWTAAVRDQFRASSVVSLAQGYAALQQQLEQQ